MLGNNRKDNLLADGVRVTHDTKVPFGTCHGDVKTSLLTQKTNFAFGITAHCAYDYSFLFAALEAINRAKFEIGILLLQYS